MNCLISGEVPICELVFTAWRRYSYQKKDEDNFLTLAQMSLNHIEPNNDPRMEKYINLRKTFMNLHCNRSGAFDRHPRATWSERPHLEHLIDRNADEITVPFDKSVLGEEDGGDTDADAKSVLSAERDDTDADDESDWDTDNEMFLGFDKDYLEPQPVPSTKRPRSPFSTKRTSPAKIAKIGKKFIHSFIHR